VPRDDRSESNLPDPFYHSIEGVERYIVRWELATPSLKMCCPNETCNDGELIHGRMNLQTAGNFAHIFDEIGTRRYAFCMPYKCNCGSKIYAGNHGDLIHSLLQPSNAILGKNTVQLHQTASQTFQALGGAYLSAEIVAERMYEALGQVSIDKELDNYSQFAGVGKRAPQRSAVCMICT
jgi:hypothetical protein